MIAGIIHKFFYIFFVNAFLFKKHFHFVKGQYNNCVFTNLTCNDYILNKCNGSITISPTMTSIKDGAFLGCKSLTNITIPSSVKTIGNYAFSYSSLKSLIFAYNSHIESIGNHSFQSCTNLTYISLPSSCKKVGDYAFDGSGLKLRIIYDDIYNDLYVKYYENYDNDNTTDFSYINDDLDDSYYDEDPTYS
jgi:hypothetical protein